MKKIIALLLAVLMVTALLAGCTSKTENPADPVADKSSTNESTDPAEDKPSTNESTDPAEDKPSTNEPADEHDGVEGTGVKIAHLTRGRAQSDFQVCMAEGCGAAVVEGDEYTVFDCAGDTETQINQIYDVIAGGWDAMVLQPSDTVALTSAIKDAIDAGIVVVLVDSNIDEKDLAHAVILNDNEYAGTLCGENLAKAMNNKGKAILYYETQQEQGIMKGQPAAAALEAAGIETIHIDGNGTQEESLEKVSAALQANPDVTGIFAYNGPSGLGAITAAESVGLKAGKDIFVVSIDCSNADIAAIKEGTLVGASTQNPYEMGYVGCKYAYDALNGGAKVGEVLVDSVWYNLDNVEGYDPGF